MHWSLVRDSQYHNKQKDASMINHVTIQSEGTPQQFYFTFKKLQSEVTPPLLELFNR
jgi:hypothetical protein